MTSCRISLICCQMLKLKALHSLSTHTYNYFKRGVGIGLPVRLSFERLWVLFSSHQKYKMEMAVAKATVSFLFCVLLNQVPTKIAIIHKEYHRSRPVFLNHRDASRYQDLETFIPGLETILKLKILSTLP